ncbi:MAG: hypothetical protein CR982_08455 [Candidatus Cloacimonadota bacterium]|nr:MAG: hypothetical protein CR982_08455 [Candidatus Cloacimonadota bacterium]PIE77889.1 MAG: hypothetical protein CSA15_10605 [Candidatus Delongbacteria bacterium]
MKKQIPLLLGIITSIIWFTEFFFQSIFFENWKANFFPTGVKIMSASMLVVAGISIIRVNWKKIKYDNERWYAVLQLFAIFLMVFLGGYRGTEVGTPYHSLYINVYAPFNSTYFAILAFYVASAAFRSFRAKSFESTLLLIAAIIVMLGKIPLGESISEYIPRVSDWLLFGPSSAGRRAILFGGYLGALTLYMRIFFGLERSHISD